MEHYINRARVSSRAVRSLFAYGHLVLAAGLIALAAGLHHVTEKPRDHVPMGTSTLLCSSVIVFLTMFAVIRLRNAHRIY